MMYTASLHLKSWGFNDPSLEAKAKGILDTSSTSNVLGFRWNRETDSLSLPKLNLFPFSKDKATSAMFFGVSQRFTTPWVGSPRQRHLQKSSFKSCGSRKLAGTRPFLPISSFSGNLQLPPLRTWKCHFLVHILAQLLQCTTFMYLCIQVMSLMAQ